MMPDEYLPPNKILFLQNLPENVTKDQLMALFSQCVGSPSSAAHAAVLSHALTGTRTCTRFVSFQRRRILPSSSTWTKPVRRSRKMRCTTTSWMARTRSRYVYGYSAQKVSDLLCLVDYIREEVICCVHVRFPLSSQSPLSGVSIYYMLVPTSTLPPGRSLGQSVGFKCEFERRFL